MSTESKEVELLVYSKPGCINCENVKMLLDDEEDIKYEVISLETTEERQEFLDKNDVKTFPQVFYKGEDGKRIGGFKDTLRWSKKRGEKIEKD